ncbi:MAG: hydrogenase maturation protease [Actinobacteria bacterium]|nr:hydrogenase maturation protease [Actinomycetota bacterium]
MTDIGQSAAAPCRTLVAGFGKPGMRDLDFGRQLVRYLEELHWPDGVVVEDLSYAAPLVLHRLQELRPAKVVLVGAVPRGIDRPGVVRRYAVDLAPPAPEVVHQRIEASLSGIVDLDHTLDVARHWGELPVDTVVIEVEPADCSFGLGFSEVLRTAFDNILALVRDEVGHDPGQASSHLDDEMAAAEATTAEPTYAAASDSRRRPSRSVLVDGHGSKRGAGGPKVSELVDYAQRHEEARLLERQRGDARFDQLAEHPSIEVVGRARPWGIGLESGGDWYDVIPLDSGDLAVVIGDVPGRGVGSVALKSDLRAAVGAYAILHGASPASLVGCLDRLVSRHGRGKGATVLYLVLSPDSGEVRLSNAGHCPPLVVNAGGGSEFVVEEGPRSEPLGMQNGAGRREVTTRLGAGSALFLFTDGLVRSAAQPMAEGLEVLRQAAASGPPMLDDLCEHILRVCSRRLRRDDDVCLLGLRQR